MHAQAQGFDSGDERLVVTAVTLPAILQSLFLDERQSFAQRVEHGCGGGVVILMVAIVAFEQPQIEIERRHRSGAFSQAFPGARRNRKRRKTRRAAQSFLSATVGDVDASLIHQHRHAAQRCDTIRDGQRAGFVRRFANRLALLVSAGGCLGLHIGDHAGLHAADEIARLLAVEHLAPGLLEPRDVGAVTARDFGNAIGEVAVGAYREGLARLGEVGHRRFHAGRAGSGDGDIEFVPRGEHVAEQLAHVFRDLEEIGIQVSHNGLPHGLVNAGRDHAGTRP
jgi:hypothetical protein